MNDVPRHLRGLEAADVTEFGVEPGDAVSLPRLIVLLPLSERERYRNRMRAHVLHQTGNPALTWAQYMDGER